MGPGGFFCFRERVYPFPLKRNKNNYPTRLALVAHSMATTVKTGGGEILKFQCVGRRTHDPVSHTRGEKTQTFLSLFFRGQIWREKKIGPTRRFPPSEKKGKGRGGSTVVEKRYLFFLFFSGQGQPQGHLISFSLHPTQTPRKKAKKKRVLNDGPAVTLVIYKQRWNSS